MALNLNTDLALITTNNPGNITLPLSSSIPGRVITFKDVLGTFGQNTLTLNTTGGDTFEDGGTTKILRESYGYIQLVASSGKWYILNGNQVNTIQVSAMTSLNISSFNISTASISLSSLSFIDNRRSTNSLNVVSTFLTYNNFIISGTKVGYSGPLNIFRFSPIALPGLSLWVDSSDRTSFVTSGTSVTRVFDKSQNNVVLSGTTGFTYNPSANLFNTSYPSFYNPTALNNATLGFNTSLSINSPMTIFFVGLKLTTGVGYVCDAGPTSTGVFTTRPYILSGNATTQMGNAGTNILTTNALISVTFSTPGSLFNNGSNVYSGSVTISPVAGFLLGNRYTLNESWDGNFCEFMLFNNALNTLQRQQVEGYLAWKWGIQANLPASHPFFSAPP